MGLKDISLKRVYDSDEEDILQEFYIPVLSNSVKYYRLAGYFSSSSLSVSALGLYDFIKNGGEMRLVTSTNLSEDDYNAIEKGIKSKSDIASEFFFKNFEELFTSNKYLKNRLKALGWMIANGKLEMKICIPKKNSNYSIYHQKIGILIDEKGNKLSFSGSDNETENAWKNNIEEFKVFPAWDKNVFENYFKSDLNKFNKFWENKGKSADVIDIPEAVKNKLIDISYESVHKIKEPSLNKYNSKVDKNKSNNITFRYYQSEAIRRWEDNSFKGILDIATGCGKTLIGVYSIIKFFNNEKRGITIITAPQDLILNQWEYELRKDILIENETIDFDYLVKCSSKNRNWKSNVVDLLHNYDRGRKDKLILLVTRNSLGTLINLISKKNRINNVFLLGDEVHSLGSNESIKVLDSISENINLNFTYKLGLSATPERFYDDKGTKTIKDFFNGVIYRYSLKKAIEENFLSKYNYYLTPITLKESEYYDYFKLTKKISKICAINSDLESDEEGYLDNLRFQRARIIKKANKKFEELKRILSNLKKRNDLDYTLIFCDDKDQLNRVIKILESIGIFKFQKIIKETDNRNEIIENFKKNFTKIILSIDILSEGINIKKANRAIILSSTNNPREFVQRRGRILRKSNLSKISEVYDFLVHAPKKSIKQNFIERKILKNELNRVEYFLENCNNYIDYLENKEIIEIAKMVDYKIY
ncbi:MAG: DEAD/DEAH box helicase family protein [Candidatus Woesearchaeota archaeon]